MMLNTFEHGYVDALNGRQGTLGSDAYKAGYRTGIRQKVADRWLTIIASAGLALAIGVVFAVALSRLVEMPV